MAVPSLESHLLVSLCNGLNGSERVCPKFAGGRRSPGAVGDGRIGGAHGNAWRAQEQSEVDNGCGEPGCCSGGTIEDEIQGKPSMDVSKARISPHVQRSPRR